MTMTIIDRDRFGVVRPDSAVMSRIEQTTTNGTYARLNDNGEVIAVVNGDEPDEPRGTTTVRFLDAFSIRRLEPAAGHRILYVIGEQVRIGLLAGANLVMAEDTGESNYIDNGLVIEDPNAVTLNEAMSVPTDVTRLEVWAGMMPESYAAVAMAYRRANREVGRIVTIQSVSGDFLTDMNGDHVLGCPIRGIRNHVYPSMPPRVAGWTRHNGAVVPVVAIPYGSLGKDGALVGTHVSNIHTGETMGPRVLTVWAPAVSDIPAGLLPNPADDDGLRERKRAARQALLDTRVRELRLVQETDSRDWSHYLERAVKDEFFTKPQKIAVRSVRAHFYGEQSAPPVPMPGMTGGALTRHYEMDLNLLDGGTERIGRYEVEQVLRQRGNYPAADGTLDFDHISEISEPKAVYIH